MKNSGLILVAATVAVAFAGHNTMAVNAQESFVFVGTTYYGGEYSQDQNSWLIDNNNQCTRIANGEFTAESLGAVVKEVCSDDNGLTNMNDIPLHNTISFAELSNSREAADFSALGGLANGTKLQIKYQNRCIVAEKRDSGLGGGPVNGVKRALDLWWQTARSLGFTNGWDVMEVAMVDQSTPLSALGTTSPCIAQAVAGPEPETQPSEPVDNSTQASAANESVQADSTVVGAADAATQNNSTLNVLADSATDENTLNQTALTGSNESSPIGAESQQKPVFLWAFVVAGVLMCGGIYAQKKRK